MCKQPAAVLGAGNLSLKRKKREEKQEEKGADKCKCLMVIFFKNKKYPLYMHRKVHLFRSNLINSAFSKANQTLIAT